MYRLDSSPSNALSLAMLYELKGRVEDAARLLDGLLRKSGGSPAVINDLAYLYAQYSTDPKVLEKAAKLAAGALAGQLIIRFSWIPPRGCPTSRATWMPPGPAFNRPYCSSPTTAL